MWFFVVMLSGHVFSSGLILADSPETSRTICINSMNAAYTDIQARYDENPYGIATPDGSIHRRHEWEVRCVK